MNSEEANEKSIMGPPVHVALISPGEMEIEDVFVKEVTKSREKTNNSLFQPRRPVFQFQTDQQTSFYAKCCSAHIPVQTALLKKKAV